MYKECHVVMQERDRTEKVAGLMNYQTKCPFKFREMLIHQARYDGISN